MSDQHRDQLLDRLNQLDLAIMQALQEPARQSMPRLANERQWVRRCLEQGRLLPVAA